MTTENEAEVTTTPEVKQTAETPEAKAPEVEAKQETKPDEKKEEQAEATLDLKLPEKSILTAGHLEKIKEFAKKENLTQEQAQARLEQDSALVSSIITDPEVRKFHVEHAKAEWKKQSETDKEIGGDKLKANLELAKFALNHPSLKSDQMLTVLNDTGFGSHPEVIRILSRVGKLLKDDSMHKGRAAPEPKDAQPWERMYGKQN